MAVYINRDPDLEWLDHVPPVGLVVAPTLLKELGLIPSRQSPIETGEVGEIIGDDLATPALSDPWALVEKVLGWEARHIAGAPGGPAIPPAERPTCGAKTRSGGTCARKVIPGKIRCRFHGGKSTGPRPPEDRARIAEAQRKRWAKQRRAGE